MKTITDSELQLILDAINDKPFSMKAAADYLDIAKKTLQNYFAAGLVTGYRPYGSLVYFRKKSLDAFAYRNKKTAAFELNEKAENILNGGIK